MADKWNGKHGEKVNIAELVRAADKASPGVLTKFEAAEARRNVARQLAALRAKAGLSQAELAKRLGISQAQISRLERADYEGHTLTSLRKYAGAVGASMTIRFSSTVSLRTVRAKASRVPRA